MISYSSFIQTTCMRLSCNIFEIWRVICQNSPTLTYPTGIWFPHWGWPHLNFEHFWRQKTRIPGLSCGVVCVILCWAVLVELRLVTDTHRQTQGHGIYRAEHSSHGKNAQDSCIQELNTAACFILQHILLTWLYFTCIINLWVSLLDVFTCDIHNTISGQ